MRELRVQSGAPPALGDAAPARAHPPRAAAQRRQGLAHHAIRRCGRGSHYFAQLDEAQVDAGIELTLDICRRHNIEPVFYYPSTTYEFPRCFQVATIICHSNCRRDKKDLCLPKFVYEKIEAAGIRLQT